MLGGQIKGREMRLYQIYSAGNFIETTEDTPFLQLGEHKYGKPILDRAVTYDVHPHDAIKLALVSMDSTLAQQSFGRHAARSAGVWPRCAQRRDPPPHQ